MGQVIQTNEARIGSDLGQIAQGTDEEGLTSILAAEAYHLCGPVRYNQSRARLH